VLAANAAVFSGLAISGFEVVDVAGSLALLAGGEAGVSD
jgi:hypothetical protein